MRPLLPALLAAALVLPASRVSTAVRQAPSPAGRARSAETALDRYVRKPDPSYRFSLAEKRPGDGHTVFVLDMVSQSWLTKAEVDRPEWRHWLTIIRPDTVAHRTGLLFIGGGNNKRRTPPERIDSGLVDIARATQSIVAELRMVPNQPLVFADDNGRERVEDELIAYSWDKFLRTGDERWPARLPMTRAAVRAMDTVTAFLAGPDGGRTTVDRFVVAGASKRGWTAWTTAAVDDRVVAVVPLVIDVLNVEPSFDHHYRAYGFYAPAVKDYQEMGIMKWLGTPQNRALMAIEDPWSYRDRLTIPKYLVNSAGDQFFLPDSWRFYYDGLEGETWLRYVPNTDHSLKGSDALASVAAFYGAILTDTPRPELTWSAGRDGRIRVETKTRPESVVLWQAVNPSARDFRLETIGPAYTSTPLAPKAKGIYEVQLEPPPAGWRAGLIELRFASGTKYPFVFTTGVTVVPDTLPHPSP